jgi:hypothetical protein
LSKGQGGGSDAAGTSRYAKSSARRARRSAAESDEKQARRDSAVFSGVSQRFPRLLTIVLMASILSRFGILDVEWANKARAETSQEMVAVNVQAAGERGRRRVRVG